MRGGRWGLTLPVALAACLLLAVFVGRAVHALDNASRAGSWVMVRLDLCFVVALLVPAAGLMKPVRSRLGTLPKGGARDAATLFLASFALVIALRLGRSPGLLFASLVVTLLFVVGLAFAAAAGAWALSGRAASLRAAWLILSAFILSAAWQAGGAPLLAYAVMR